MTIAQVPVDQKVNERLLIDHICSAIELNHGWIGFDDYMKLVLYTPGLGYYASGQQKFGVGGDFITAPEMGDLFGQCLARQTKEVLQQLEQGLVLEFGAGSGALALTVLDTLETLGQLPEKYYILELSSELRDRQRKTFEAKAPHHLARIEWLDALPTRFNGVVIANELLDAMPVKCFELDRSGSMYERGVSIENRGGTERAFCWKNQLADKTLSSAVNALGIQFDTEQYRSEMHFQARAWMRSLYGQMQSGAVFIIDYGFAQGEYYHPDRVEGTLMCHYQHHAHDDPFFMPGAQDITSHVDFSAIAVAAQHSGFDVVGYASQGAFLLSLGLLDHLQMEVALRDQIEQAQQIKKLTLPHEMGELFKVLAVTKLYDQSLTGFSQQNNVYRL